MFSVKLLNKIDTRKCLECQPLFNFSYLYWMILRNNMKASGSKKDTSSQQNLPTIGTLEKKTKISQEITTSDLLFYYGLFVSSHQTDSFPVDLDVSLKESLHCSKSDGTNENESIVISDEECLTLYDKRTELVSCVHFKSKHLACIWYNKLFKMAYGSTSHWTCFEPSHLPDLIKSEPRYFAITTDNSSTAISGMIRNLLTRSTTK